MNKKNKKSSSRIVTSVDVAELAGVSQSAVSRCFTPGASISEKMREKILSASNELGFRPNALARSLITKQSKIIGVVFSYLSNQYYPTVLELLSLRLQERGYHVLLFLANDESNMDNILDEIIQYQVDGLILGSMTLSSKLAKKCADFDIPVVLFNRVSDYGNLSSVTSDNFTGGYKIAEFLALSSHKRIAYIAGLEESSTNRDREKGLLKGLSDYSLTLFDKEIGGYNFEIARKAIHTLFNRNKQSPPDAVFVANDHMALSVMDTIRYELKLSIPEEVSVIGYDDVPQASWLSYQLTTVRQSARSMVNSTISILMEQIEQEDALTSKILIDGHLIVRHSSKQPDLGEYHENLQGKVIWRR